MKINCCEIDNGLFELYCHAIKAVIRSPTLSADLYRRDIHDRLMRECGVSRENKEFSRELNRVVYELIDYKETVRY